MSDRPGVSVLVPVLDEAPTIRAVLDRIAALPFDAEIIVVDDGSTDGTAAVLERWVAESPRHVVIRQAHRGKGAAVRTAIARASGEFCVIQDADAEYDPADIPRLIEPLAQDRADVVYGSRLLPGMSRQAFGRRQLLGNLVVTRFARLLYGTSLTDVETGDKAFRTVALRGLPLREDGFAIETEITAWACRARLRFVEVPIAYSPRTYADGKKITWRDGVRALGVLLRCRVRAAPRRAPTGARRPGPAKG